MKLLKQPKFQVAAAIFLLIFALGIIWSLSVPGNTEAPDESSHLNMISFLKTEKRIPIFNGEAKIVQTVYDPKLPSGAYYSMAYNSPLSYLPYLGFYNDNAQDLQKVDLLSLRLVSSFFLALFSVFLFLCLDKIKPQKTSSALVVTLFTVLIPQVIFSAGYVNIEPFALFLATMSFYLFLQYRQKQTILYIILFGVSLGLLGLSKSNYLVFLTYLGLLMIFDLIKTKSWSKLAKNYLLIILIFILVNSWWWLRNYGLYGDPLILGYIKREIVDKAPAWLVTFRQQGYGVLSIFKVSDFRQYTFLGFFANLGGANIYLPLIFYWLFYLINLVLFIFSLIKKDNRVYIYSFLILSVTFILYFANKNLDDFSPQGRHLFPLLVPLSVVLFLGLGELKKLSAKIVYVVLVSFGLLSSMVGLLLTYTSYYVQQEKGVGATSVRGLWNNLSWLTNTESVTSVADKLSLSPGQSVFFVVSIGVILAASIYFYHYLLTKKQS